MKRTITIESIAMLMSHQTIEGVKSGCDTPLFAQGSSLEYYKGCARIGTASITITLDTPAEIKAGQLAVIDAAIAKNREEASNREAVLLDARGKLLALTNEVAA